ncbi:hypothetical protein [Nostoc paludosum]|nr:hypothetical protein [Nostoc paludosum]
MGHWALGIGHWALGIGLGIGHWLFPASPRLLIPLISLIPVP